MREVTVPTYTASIYVGTREQYTPTVRDLEMARELLHQYVNKVHYCVSLTPTEFIYTGHVIEGENDPSDFISPRTNTGEPGFIVGLINYPRFPSSPAEIKRKALDIAEGLRLLFKQFKVTVVFPDETVMLDES